MRIAATPEAITVWPGAISTRLRAMAASPTRASTTVSGGSSSTATLANKNDPPHRTESDSSQIQTRNDMTPN